MRTLPRLLVLGVATSALACADALPTESLPSAPDASIELSRGVVGLAVGDTVRLTATVRTRAGAGSGPSALRWRTSDSTVAVVEDGLIVPLRAGSARVTASVGDAAASATVNVWTGAAAQRLVIQPDTTRLEAGGATLASAALQYSTGTVVRLRTSVGWKSVNTGIATITRGRVVAKSSGETRIVATLGGLTDTAHVVVAAGAAPAPQPVGPVPSTERIELPRVYLDMPMPKVTGRTIRVNAGDNLQAAIDAAEPGDELVLQAGATFVGPYRLPKKSGDAWIVIRTSGVLPPEGTRVTPAHAAQMPKLVSQFRGEPVIETRPGAHHYRLVGLEITAPDTETTSYTLVSLGSGGKGQNAMELQPHHLVLDRMYVHGLPRLNFQRCIGLHSAYTAIVDSWISECHGKGFDSQAIGGWNGTGPYKIVNNHLAGAGENVMFGGADPAIPGALPRDIEFRRNHVYKPKEWKGVWSVKNAFELKIGQRVLVEGNVFENVWPDAQTGFALNFKSTNQSGRAPWSETSDVTVRYNVVRNSANGVSISAAPGSKEAVPASRFLFAHNVFERIGTGDYAGGRLFQVAGIHGLTIVHNTAESSHSSLILAGGERMRDLVIRDNVFLGARYGIAGNGRGSGTQGLDARAEPGWVFSGNVLAGAPAAQYPAGNAYPRRAEMPDVASIGHDDPPPPGAAAPAASARREAGADLRALRAHTAGVVLPESPAP